MLNFLGVSSKYLRVIGIHINLLHNMSIQSQECGSWYQVLICYIVWLKVSGWRLQRKVDILKLAMKEVIVLVIVNLVSNQPTESKNIRYQINGKKCQLKLVGTLIVVRWNQVVWVVNNFIATLHPANKSYSMYLQRHQHWHRVW